MEPRELLIIDDEESLHKVLGECLRARGFTVYSASDGRNGLELFRKHGSIRVVLTDIRIPGMDGLEVLKAVKRHDPLTQVILMTAFSDAKLAIQALRLGADDYLEKPFHLDVLNDILERSFDRQRLGALSHRWQQFVEHLPIGLIWCSPEGIIEGVTPAAEGLLNRAQQEIAGYHVWQVPDLESARVFFNASDNGSQVASVEIETGGRALILQPMDTTDQTERNSRLLVLTDITDEKELHRELAALSQELEGRVADRTRSLTNELEFSQRLLDTVGVVIVVLDAEGKILRINKFAEDLTRYTRLEAEQVFSSFAKHSESPLSRIFSPRSQDELSGLIAELPLRDGTKRILSWSTRELPSRSGHGARLIIGIDVTEQKQLETKLKSYNVQLEHMVESSSHELRQTNAQLIHAARLASLGEIAAGIAHEMKQPLNVISITADLIKLLQKNGTLSEDLLVSNLDKIRRTVDRMANTINHLRGFTRIDSANFEPVRIADAMDGALSILGEQIRLDDIDIVREVPPNLSPILGEQHQIEQVLVNLMQNARHAIEERLSHAEAAGQGNSVPKRISLRAGMWRNGREVYIEVSDTGTGMDEETRHRIFEPFYTTKQADRGTGLGLSISMNIVQSHGGTIEVESTPGEGSTFRVLFPTELPD
ncbi:MAG: response regulator [Calditrichota bacterium]